MARWETEAALRQALMDMLAENQRDRDVITLAEQRLRGRIHLVKMLRRRFRRQGLVNASGDSMAPYWVRREDVR